MRRAMTWAARRSVSVKTAKIELSASRQAKSTWRTSRATSRAASRLERRSALAERKPRDRKPDAAFFRFADGAVEIAPERVVGEKPGIGIDHALGVERDQHAAQPLPERVHAHIGQEAFGEPRRSVGDAFEIGADRGNTARRYSAGRRARRPADRESARRRPERSAAPRRPSGQNLRR